MHPFLSSCDFSVSIGGQVVDSTTNTPVSSLRILGQIEKARSGKREKPGVIAGSRKYVVSK